MTYGLQKEAVEIGHSVALAVAVKRFRDEYRWSEHDVRNVGMKLVSMLNDRIDREIDTIASDMARMEAIGRSETHMRDCVIAAFALIGAQVCESFEMARRAERN